MTRFMAMLTTILLVGMLETIISMVALSMTRFMAVKATM